MGVLLWNSSSSPWASSTVPCNTSVSNESMHPTLEKFHVSASEVSVMLGILLLIGYCSFHVSSYLGLKFRLLSFPIYSRARALLMTGNNETVNAWW